MPRLLDLFCGAGGAAMGYSRTGFEVVGVDLKPQPSYPFEFHQADALEYLAAHGSEFDAIHASPPCQAYVDSANKAKHPRLIEPTRNLLKATGRPFVIENVDKAPLFNWVMLCGTMFGLRVIRHRLFECSWGIPMSPYTCNHWGMVSTGEFAGVYSRGGYGPRYRDDQGRKGRWGLIDPHVKTVKFFSECMGIDWMKNRYELTQAIPPAFTEFIGSALLHHLEAPDAPARP